MSAENTVWQYGVEGSGYHAPSCPCTRHCGNCFADLDDANATPRERYCSDYCRNRAKRERALDRLLSSAPTANTKGS